MTNEMTASGKEDANPSIHEENAKLLFAIANNDREAFHKFYALFHKLIKSICLKYVGNNHMAEDASQQTFFKIARFAHKYDPKLSNPSTWVGTIAANTAIDLRRKRARTAKNIFKYARKAESADDSSKDINREDLRSELSKIREEYTDVLSLRMRGLDVKSIAKALGIPEGTVKTRTDRGKAALRKRLESAKSK